MALCLLAPTPANAQPVFDRLLAGVSVKALGECAVIDVAFNKPVSYAGHFPPARGLELMIRVEQLGTEQTPVEGRPEAEAASITPGNAAGLVSVTFDAGRANPQLRLGFDHAVHFNVGRDTDSRHIIVTTRTDGDPSNCQSSGNAKEAGSAGGAAAALVDGKKVLAQKQYSRAVALFTKAAGLGDGEVKRDAQEYLGLARERAGQLAHAKAEYQAYLKAYPTGAGSERVRQRLAGVIAAAEADADARQKGRKAELEKAGKPPKSDLGGIAGRLETAGKGDLGPGKESEPRGWTWHAYGSAGQFYYRSDGYDDIRLLRGTYGTHAVDQNELVSSADITLRGESANSDIEVRASAYQENGFDSRNGDNRTSVSTAYVDMSDRPSGLSVRVGRQSRNGGGVFGRFDGGLATWKVDKHFSLRAVGGSPVYYKSVEPFADGRYFYGAGLDMTTVDESLSATLYAIEQDVSDVIDRRAIGGEVRYAEDIVTAYGGLDFDVYYGEINSAYVSASWLPVKDLTIYANADYRHVPFLLTSNALIGQSVDSLSDLVDLFGHDATEALALDRTALAETVMVGASYRLNEDWQVALDATIANYTGTPASGGVDAIPDPGTEYYVSAQLNGGNVFTANDYLGLGLRYLDSSSYRTYMADMSLRYPVNEKLRLNPRLRIAYRDSKSSDATQLLIMPSLGSRYSVTDHWKFEIEAGARFESNTSSLGDGQNVEFLLTAGYRYEF